METEIANAFEIDLRSGFYNGDPIRKWSINTYSVLTVHTYDKVNNIGRRYTIPPPYVLIKEGRYFF